MKTIEKIAIDQILSVFEDSKKDLINSVITARQAVEVANQNFKKAAGPLMNHAKESLKEIESELSDEGVAYFEEKMSSILKVPFKKG